jgi:hypothetical protein
VVSWVREGLATRELLWSREESMNQVSFLGLRSIAVLVKNTVRMNEALAYAHLIPNGTCHFDRPLATVWGEEA